MILLIRVLTGMQFFSSIFATNLSFSAVDLNNAQQFAAKRVKRDGVRCVLPPATADKKYEVKLPSDDVISDAKPGETVPQFSILLYQCNKGYMIDYGSDILSKESTTVCINGSWQPRIVKCKKICKELHLPNFNMTCYQYSQGPKTSCSGVLLEGAVVKPKCQFRYHPSMKVNYDYVTCEKDGTWNKPFFMCFPDCGKLSNRAINLISHGQRELRGNAPWYVPIYSTELSKTPSFICGGTLINDELVISAAHCFFDEKTRKKQDPELFHVVVGKMNIDYAMKDYPTTKTHKIRGIYFPDTTYTGASTHFAADIAILHLSQKVTFSPDVHPACIYWHHTERFNPGENVAGKLSGFGVTEDGALSKELRTTNLPYISYAACLKRVQEEFIDALSVDKFCAGSETGPGAQPGDSGGGLLFVDKMNGLFHLRGVVSNKQVIPSSIATFTDVALYLPWISKTLETVHHVNLKAQQLIDSPKPSAIQSQHMCSKPCSQMMDPICATDGKINITFNNPCLLHKKNCNEKTEFREILSRNCPNNERMPTTTPKWMKYSFGDICENAVLGGQENSVDEPMEPNYVARLPVHENYLVGKMIPSQDRTHAPLRHFAPSFYQYEMLCGKGSTKWVSASHGVVPSGAIVAAKTINTVREENIYICRVEIESGSIIPGKLLPSAKVCSYPHQGRAVNTYYYDVLVQDGASEAPRWMKPPPGDICADAVVGGYQTRLNETTYIARVPMKENALIGKLVPTRERFYIPSETKEYSFTEYELLCGGSPKWISGSRGKVPKGAFPGAKYVSSKLEENIYICRARESSGALIPGKLHPSKKICVYPTSPGENSKNHYEVLVF